MKRNRVPISPGAWWIEREPGTISIRAPGGEVCYVPNVTDTDRANAEAIAKVPQLVAALRSCREIRGAWETDQATGEAYATMIDKALEGIA